MTNNSLIAGRALRREFLVFAALICFGIPTFADQVVYFVHGKAIRVKSVEAGEKFTILEMEGGGSMGVPNEQIVRIEEYQVSAPATGSGRPALPQTAGRSVTPPVATPTAAVGEQTPVNEQLTTRQGQGPGAGGNVANGRLPAGARAVPVGAGAGRTNRVAPRTAGRSQAAGPGGKFAVAGPGRGGAGVAGRQFNNRRGGNLTGRGGRSPRLQPNSYTRPTPPARRNDPAVRQQRKVGPAAGEPNTGETKASEGTASEES